MEKKSNSRSSLDQYSGGLSVCRLTVGLSECTLNLVDDDQERQLLRYSEMERCFKQSVDAGALMSYRVKGEQIRDLAGNEGVEEEDALRLMNMICGGYVEDDFANYLSYQDFLEKKEEFDILRSIYQSIQKKYRNRKVEEGCLKFRSVLLMVYL